MFPGFVNTYKDKNNNVHLYFFPGIDDNGASIYNKIDMKDILSDYNMIDNEDGSSDICFYNNKIIKVNVKLIKTADASVINQTFTIYWLYITILDYI